ncbi:MAG: GIY-YIG nuclease family protein [candidate division WWE3 bacterium]|nr:GIY-YIG nuclease family protein [candidate division WWE3 bacterium]
MYYVYALYNSKHQRRYVGQTSNLAKRLAAHNTHSSEGAKSTAAFDGSWQLIYQEAVATKSEALKREHYLKTYQGRKLITAELYRWLLGREAPDHPQKI